MQKNLLKKSSISKKDRKRYQNLINEINNFEEMFQTFSSNELRAHNFKLKKRYQKSQNLNSIISESFAITREASLRTLGLRHFDVQLIGGLVLNDQKIAEMKTGEGKTLVATLPASLNALSEKGVHIVTVNDYLASRDQASMGQIYKFLGLSTGLIQSTMSKVDRKKNYNSDITYVTNDQVAFDYLHDNTALNLSKVVLRTFNYCIIDEVDSVLIDEAQTPLILADNIETPIEKYIIAAELMNYLKATIHFTVDEKNKNIILTSEGNKQAEKILRVQDLYDPKDPWITYVINAIKAKTLFSNNVHYIIQNNRIVIVDEFTGRIMPDRRWSDGLHQAIEAKEQLPIRQTSETSAAITYQNFFLLYPKLSGMTGTGKTAEIEFEKIYKLSVDVIPTAKPTLRKDLPDLIFKDQFSKWNAIAKTCNKISSTGQPILIGTTTVEKSEMLAELLKEYNLSYQLLNAKPDNVRRESEIVAQAGKKHTITIATNMAGRGTDIILGGNIMFIVEKKLYEILTFSRNYVISKKKNIFESIFKKQLDINSQKFLSVLFSLLQERRFLQLSDVQILRLLRETDKMFLINDSINCSIKFLIKELTSYYKKHQQQENQIVKNLGGLYIIGTERNDSRRVDNQLRGRCGRQGDPGTSQFFLSLDDNLLRLFGGTKIQNLLQSQMTDDSPLESNILTKSLNAAQQKVEERAYQQRKDLFEYDDILNQQRQIIYSDRKLILFSSPREIEQIILGYGEQVITDSLLELKKNNISKKQIISIFENLFGTNLTFHSNDLIELKSYLFLEFWRFYEARQLEAAVHGDRTGQNIEQKIILINIDRLWREHIQQMTLIREAVGWRSYGQQNPLYEYKREALKMFYDIAKDLRHSVIYDLLTYEIL